MPLSYVSISQFFTKASFIFLQSIRKINFTFCTDFLFMNRVTQTPSLILLNFSFDFPLFSWYFVLRASQTRCTLSDTGRQLLDTGKDDSNYESSLKKGSKESLTSVKSEEPPSSPATTHISIQVTHRSSKSGRSHILPLLLLIIAAVLLLFLLTVFPGSVSVFFSLNT